MDNKNEICHGFMEFQCTSELLISVTLFDTLLTLTKKSLLKKSSSCFKVGLVWVVRMFV